MALFGGSDDDLRHRIANLERRVAALERAASGGASTAAPSAAEPSEVWASTNVLNLVMQGRKIEAVKALRQETGLGLKQAKDIIDGL